MGRLSTLALALSLILAVFSPAPSVAHAQSAYPRWFGQTGFGIDNDTIWNYFTR